jgi:hypothetical protein
MLLVLQVPFFDESLSKIAELNAHRYRSTKQESCWVVE